jgi:hypothetical protein
MSETNKSEIARLREQIAMEYQASQRVFTEFTANGRHEFISKRQENIARIFEDLRQYMSPDDAMQLVIQVGDQIQGASVSSGSTS